MEEDEPAYPPVIAATDEEMRGHQPFPDCQLVISLLQKSSRVITVAPPYIFYAWIRNRTTLIHFAREPGATREK
jgi:hypothetical protein